MSDIYTIGGAVVNDPADFSRVKGGSSSGPDFSRVKGGSSTTAPAKGTIERAFDAVNEGLARPLNALNDWLSREARDIREDVGLDEGATGVVSKALGIPRWLIVAGVVGFALMAAAPYVAPIMRRR